MSRKLKVKVAVLVRRRRREHGGHGRLAVPRCRADLSLDGYTRGDASRKALRSPDRAGQGGRGRPSRTPDTYDDIFQSKARKRRLHGEQRRRASRPPTRRWRSTSELLGVDNVHGGGPRRHGGRQSAQVPQAELLLMRDSTSCRTVFDDGEPSAGGGGGSCPNRTGWDALLRRPHRRFGRMVVVEQDPAELLRAHRGRGLDGKRAQEHQPSAQHGYHVCRCRAADYLVDVPPAVEPGRTADALDGGIDVADLEDGAFALDDARLARKLYCGVSKVGDAYYVAAVPESDMAAVAQRDGGRHPVRLLRGHDRWSSLYGVFVLREDERRGRRSSPTSAPVGPLRYNKTIGQARRPCCRWWDSWAFCVISFYMQTLFALSSESVANNERVNEIERHHPARERAPEQTSSPRNTANAT